MRKCGKSPLSLGLLVVAAGLALAACQGGRGPGLGDPPPPLAEGPAFELAERLYLVGQEPPAVAARGAADYLAPNGGRHHFEFESFVQKPDVFSFLLLGPAGSPAFRVLMVGDSAYALDYGQKTYLTGTRDELNRARLPLPMSPEELLALLSGALAEPPAKASAQRLGTTQAPKSELLVWSASEGDPMRLTLDGAPGAEKAPVLRRLSALTRSGELLTVAYDDIRGVDRRDQASSLAFPHKITAVVGGGRAKRSLSIRYAEVVLGAVLPRESFRLDPPPGFAWASL
ncbi:MAG: DUF4292 domain-containing protein [Deltaproteobacteria bacterium]|jgi:hypothetical protein|nr:DUF4292 domain-containing protein [Deltaproteobacteria bacterium]